MVPCQRTISKANEGGVYSQGNADDIRLQVVGKCLNMELGLIQWTLNTFEVWCDELGLSVNSDKTGLIAFMRRKLQVF